MDRNPKHLQYVLHYLCTAGESFTLTIASVDCVWEKNMAFAQVTGKTEQLVRLHATMLPDGTKVTFKLRKPKSMQPRKAIAK